jgi:Predicted nuclease of the RecB family
MTADGHSGSAETLYNPSAREAMWQITDAVSEGAVASVFGVCQIEYDGRASSSLPIGARLVLLKPDGTALVHTDENRKPVNWQPPGGQHTVSITNGQLVVKSTRTSPEELLEVTFEAVTRVTAYQISGQRSTDVIGTEEMLREYLLANPDEIEEGFTPRATEYQTDAGPVDIYGYDQDNTPVVIELKRRRVGPDAVGQLTRYVTSLEDTPRYDTVRGILIAPSITDTATERLAENGHEHIAMAPPESPPTQSGEATTKLSEWSG